MGSTIIMQHKIYGLHGEPLLLSTVKIGNLYETALLTPDGDEWEMHISHSRSEAVKMHRKLENECIEKAKATYPGISNYWQPGQIVKKYRYSKWA